MAGANFFVLQPMRPAPQNLALSHVRKISRQRPGQHDDIAIRQQLAAAAHTSEMARQLIVRHAEALTIAMLE